MYLMALRSKDSVARRNALSRIGSAETRPSDEELSEVVALIQDADGDVRRDAVFAAGVHWRLRASWMPTVNALLRFSEDSWFQEVSILALKAVAEEHEDLRGELTSLLLSIVLDTRRAPEVRWLAHTTGLRSVGALSEAEWAALSESMPEGEIDWRARHEEMTIASSRRSKYGARFLHIVRKDPRE